MHVCARAHGSRHTSHADQHDTDGGTEEDQTESVQFYIFFGINTYIFRMHLPDVGRNRKVSQNRKIAIKRMRAGSEISDLLFYMNSDCIWQLENIDTADYSYVA